jgi:lactoylglutathione lyase
VFSFCRIQTIPSLLNDHANTLRSLKFLQLRRKIAYAFSVNSMAGVIVMSANVRQAVPFFGVTDMESSLRFYVDGLGFAMKRKWIPDADEHYASDELSDGPSAGKVRWCWLELGDAAIMLQEFAPQRRPESALGAGASVSFQCEDALVLYRGFRSRGVRTSTRPFVGNGLWVVPLTDPDGYRIDFSSPTDAAEESELEEAE